MSAEPKAMLLADEAVFTSADPPRGRQHRANWTAPCSFTSVLAAAMATLLVGTAATGASGGTLTEVAAFGSNPGNLRMFKYVPESLQDAPPLVVALHGCRQTASDYDDETGWAALADRHHFVLLLPQQKGFVLSLPTPGFSPEGLASPLPALPWSLLDVNNALGCFNWFEPGDIGRNRGEALSIKQMIDRMTADHGVDSSRIFVTGLSAGGAMAAVMLATYPEVFVGAAIIAGLPYGCAARVPEAFACMSPGKDLRAAEWGDRVRNATSHTGPWAKVSIWQGSSDRTVRPGNATELLEQWTDVHGIDQTPDAEDTVNGYPHKVFTDGEGNALVETFDISSMGHGVPVDPGRGEEQCGIASAFILDADICSSLHIARFWGVAGN